MLFMKTSLIKKFSDQAVVRIRYKFDFVAARQYNLVPWFCYGMNGRCDLALGSGAVNAFFPFLTKQQWKTIAVFTCPPDHIPVKACS